MVSTRQLEIRLLRWQTIIAGLNVSATVVLSVASIWIAHTVNVTAERDKQYEDKEDKAITDQRTHENLVSSCLNLKLLNIVGRDSLHIDNDEFAELSSNIESQCRAAGISYKQKKPETRIEILKQLLPLIQKYSDSSKTASNETTNK